VFVKSKNKKLPDTLAVLWAYLTHRLLAEHSRWLLFRT